MRKIVVDLGGGLDRYKIARKELCKGRVRPVCGLKMYNKTTSVLDFERMPLVDIKHRIGKWRKPKFIADYGEPPLLRRSPIRTLSIRKLSIRKRSY